jgi:hypothetical protein
LRKTDTTTAIEVDAACAAGVALRFDMSQVLTKKRCCFTASVAAVTILAMLLAPFCGSLCGFGSGCASVTTIIDETGCHHGTISSGDAGSAILTAASRCNRPDSLATLSDFSEQSSVHQEAKATFPLHTVSTSAVLKPSFDPNGSPHGPGVAACFIDIPTSTTALRI